ncbi:MAG: transporter [Syntrophobacteraceae bacterium]
MKKGFFQKDRFVVGLAVIGLLVGLLGAGPGWAYQQPGVNLGFTSFLDGGPPAGPGFYFTQYLQYYHSDRLNNANGNRLLPPAADENLDAWVSLSQFIYQSNTEILLGGKWGLDLIIPVVSIDLDHRLPIPLEDNGAGLGDIVVGPFLQWDPIMGANGPIFMHRFEFQVLFPTGKYDSDRELNPGSNFFSIDPYWAATVFITPKWTASTRIHYLWNAENDDPNRGFLGAHDTQAGQAVHLNFATDYELWEKRLRAGLNGYYLKQVTDDQRNGTDLPDTKEQVLGIGPGMVFHYSKDTHFFLNLYFETAAENRSEGVRLTMRWVQHF